MRLARVLEEMTVELGEGQTRFSFAQGDPPEAAPLPDLFGPIAGTEISWMELSFSFFWWPEPQIVGTEKVANRWECQIIEIACPPEYPRRLVACPPVGGAGLQRGGAQCRLDIGNGHPAKIGD